MALLHLVPPQRHHGNRVWAVAVVLLVPIVAPGWLSWSGPQRHSSSSNSDADARLRRRSVFVATAPLVLAASVADDTAEAFANRVTDGPAAFIPKRKKQLFEPEPAKEYEDMWKESDTKKVGRRLIGCQRGSMNCFSSTSLRRSGCKIDAWNFTGKASAQEAFREVRAAVDAYPPGQNDIDGGGFQVAFEDKDYMRVEYESLRFAYIDDVEFLLGPVSSTEAGSGQVQVRSSSRQGKADFGVNAMRLNKLGSILKKKGGWAVRRITRETHPKYYEENCNLPETKLICI